MDIYFSHNWGVVNQYIEAGEPQEFLLESKYGTIHNLYILREVPVICDGKQYYDIATPYGYGGPHIVDYKDGCKELLLNEYIEKFGQHCADSNIVSEFIRFHPVAGNGADFINVYNVEFDRHTVGTDLTASGDSVELEFSKSCRKNIRRALKAGVTWKIIPNPTEVKDFIRVYYSTMDRDEAGQFYYFPEEYFQKCLELFGEQVLLVQAIFENKTIAAGFYITSEKVIHAHLSGTLNEYLYLSPAYVLKYATVEWGKKHGYKLIHYGGGTSRDPENSLYKFKLKFTKKTIFDFYIGRKVWNEEIYDRLVQITGKRDSEYFPKYRG